MRVIGAGSERQHLDSSGAETFGVIEVLNLFGNDLEDRSVAQLALFSASLEPRIPRAQQIDRLLPVLILHLARPPNHCHVLEGG